MVGGVDHPYPLELSKAQEAIASEPLNKAILKSLL